MARVDQSDDADFGAGGTIANWTAAGIQVSYCLLTNGDQGGIENVARDQMGALRQVEQRAAGLALGVTDIEFLNHRDGHLEPTIARRGEVVRAIRRVRPHRMLIQSPERNWERIYASHPDHLAAGEIAIQAVYPDARNEFAFTDLLAEGFEPWSVPEVWVMGNSKRDHYVDITDTIGHKLNALRAHASQTDHMPDLEGRINEWGQLLAAEAGMPSGRLAEGFLIVNTA